MISTYSLFLQSAAPTVSAAQRTSRRGWAVSVYGAKLRRCGSWGTTASLTVPGDTTAGTTPASVTTSADVMDVGI